MSLSIIQVLPEDLRQRLQRAKLTPLCWKLGHRAYVKLSKGNFYKPEKVSEITVHSGGPKTHAKIIREAENILGGPLPI